MESAWEKKRDAYRILVGKARRERVRYEARDVVVWIILKWILKREIGWGGVE
jgi:hypothetical protein